MAVGTLVESTDGRAVINVLRLRDVGNLPASRRVDSVVPSGYFDIFYERSSDTVSCTVAKT